MKKQKRKKTFKVRYDAQGRKWFHVGGGCWAHDTNFTSLNTLYGMTKKDYDKEPEPGEPLYEFKE